MNFTGKYGEELVMCYMEGMGYDVTLAPPRVFYDWDLKCVNGSDEITIEVKYDSKAYMWAKRRKTPDQPNLYIEFKNTKKDSDSGIIMSKSDFYFYILKLPDGRNMCHMFARKELLEYLKVGNFKVVGNSSSGDDNALGWIPPLHELMNEYSGYRGTIDLTGYGK